MVQVYSSGNPMDAHMMRDRLAEHGIESVIMGEALWGARGGLPLTPDTTPSIWVNEENADGARRLIREWSEGSS